MCGEAARLLAEYNSAVLDASKAAQNLADVAGTSSGDDFILLGSEKTRANVRLKKAREGYERHINDHGCGTLKRSAQQGEWT